MNKLRGTIIRIESSEHMSLVDIDVQGDIFCAIVLETPLTANYLTMGRRISLLFKETEVAIAKDLFGQISLRNRFKATIKAVDESVLLTKLTLNYKAGDIVSIISTRSAKQMGLSPNGMVEWLVKTNEISLLEEGGL